MTKKKDRIITFILVLIIIILINAIINQFNPSLDLTRDKVYSLSKESKTLIKNIKEPMSVKFFITPNLPPPFSTYEKYVRDIFEEYKSKNISFEIIDASKNQSLANQYGISSSQISVLERDQTQTKVAYMGLAFLYGDSIETIPFIESTEGLEYRIDTAIRKMIDKNDKLKRLENNLNVENAGEFFSLVRRKNSLALNVLEIWKKKVAILIANLQMLFDVDVFVLSGGVMKSSDLFIDDLPQMANDMILKFPLKPIKIVLAKFDQDAGLMGGACVAFND